MEIDPADVLQKYAALVQRRRSGVIQDASFLPYPKEAIKIVLRICLGRVDDDAEREAFIAAYIGLCDFLEHLSNEEWDAADIMGRIFTGGTSDDANAARAQLTVAIGKTYESLIRRQAVEREKLTEELRSLCFNNGPREPLAGEGIVG
jgi:hypothetical protein